MIKEHFRIKIGKISSFVITTMIAAVMLGQYVWASEPVALEEYAEEKENRKVVEIVLETTPIEEEKENQDDVETTTKDVNESSQDSKEDSKTESRSSSSMEERKREKSSDKSVERVDESDSETEENVDENDDETDEIDEKTIDNNEKSEDEYSELKELLSNINDDGTLSLNLFTNLKKDKAEKTYYSGNDLLKFSLERRIMKNDISVVQLLDEDEGDTIVYLLLDEDETDSEEIIGNIDNGELFEYDDFSFELPLDKIIVAEATGGEFELNIDEDFNGRIYYFMIDPDGVSSQMEVIRITNETEENQEQENIEDTLDIEKETDEEALEIESEEIDIAEQNDSEETEEEQADSNIEGEVTTGDTEESSDSEVHEEENSEEAELEQGYSEDIIDEDIASTTEEDSEVEDTEVDNNPIDIEVIKDEIDISDLPKQEIAVDNEIKESVPEEEKNLKDIDENDKEIISVEVPTSFEITMLPYEDGTILVLADDIVMANHSESDISLIISNISVNIQKDNVDNNTSKTCELKFIIEDENGIQEIDLQEGDNPIDYVGVAQGLENSANDNKVILKVSGAVTDGSNDYWRSGDLGIKITYEFKHISKPEESLEGTEEIEDNQDQALELDKKIIETDESSDQLEDDDVKKMESVKTTDNSEKVEDSKETADKKSDNSEDGSEEKSYEKKGVIEQDAPENEE